MKITIPNPCSEDWQTMTATEKGRFCAVCQKCVVDFTTMTDAEIIRYLDGQKGKTCGRFTKEQLNRPLTPPNRFKMPLSKWVLASTFSLGFMSPKEGFAAVPMVQTQKIFDQNQKVVISQNIDNEIFTDSLVVTGHLFDSFNKEAITYANIVIKGTTRGTSVDSTGNFSLIIPTEYQQKKIILVVSAIGYETREIVVKLKNVQKKLHIKMTEMVLGGIAFVNEPRIWDVIKPFFKKRNS
jgi:hypothetical protein